jgi:hypothetical protein
MSEAAIKKIEAEKERLQNELDMLKQSMSTKQACDECVGPVESQEFCEPARGGARAAWRALARRAVLRGSGRWDEWGARRGVNVGCVWVWCVPQVRVLARRPALGGRGHGVPWTVMVCVGGRTASWGVCDDRTLACGARPTPRQVRQSG